MSQYRLLKPTKQKLKTKKFFGFDIETADKNKTFVLASIVGDGYEKFFYSKEEIKNEIRTNKIFRDSEIFATNLGFDFFGVYFNEGEFLTYFKGTGLYKAQAFFYRGQIQKENKGKNNNKLQTITFLDSMNYASLSVEKMGEIIGVPKLEKPIFIGEKPKNKEEWEYLKKYNLQDSYITYKFMIFLKETFEHLGATLKDTLASTSMSLFRNEYLDNNYFCMTEEKLLEQFKSYYGGRTEVFKRGKIEKYNYYDFNSLYPSVMGGNIYPNPNYLRVVRENNINNIILYEGCSDVEIFIPYMKYPPLPYRKENGRVIFPHGTFRGWYTHIELNYAMHLGAEIKFIHKTHLFTHVCSPFKRFVNDLYNLRNEFKKDKNKMEYVVKITLNSLYGKFGQRFERLDNWIHESLLTIENLDQISDKRGQYVCISEKVKPAVFCIPIWASYVTAYGRIKLHKAIVKYSPVYVDTDSLMTKENINTSDALGDLKLEEEIKEGLLIRPKFYGYKSKTKEYIKIKGLTLRLNYEELQKLLINPTAKSVKFAKFKESLRRGFTPNEIIPTIKTFSLEDEKRIWKNKFNPAVLEDSEPIKL